MFGLEQYLDHEELEDMRIGMKENKISWFDFMNGVSYKVSNFIQSTLYLPSDKDMRWFIERTYFELKEQR